MAKIDWTTWVTILLAAIGVLIAALGVLFTIASVVLGALAIFGFRDLKASVIEQAAKAASEAASKSIEVVIASYPSAAQMREEIFERVASQEPPVFRGKFDIEASAETVTTTETDVPPSAANSVAVAETYPSEVDLPQSDAPPNADEDRK